MKSKAYFDLLRSLEARCEKSSEGPNEADEQSNDQHVHRKIRDLNIEDQNFVQDRVLACVNVKWHQSWVSEPTGYSRNSFEKSAQVKHEDEGQK